MSIVFVGDSITFGQHIDPVLRWTSLVTDELVRRYLDTPVHIVTLNRGVSGETTRMGLERFPADVQAHFPDVMTLQFGLNDCNCWVTDRGLPRVSENAFRANLIEMIERARRFGVQRIILANNHPTVRHKPMLSGEPYESANSRYSTIIEEVAASTDVTFCDIRSAFSGYSERELHQLLLPYPDQLHLSVEGNRVYAEAIMPFVETSVGEILQMKEGVVEA